MGNVERMSETVDDIVDTYNKVGIVGPLKAFDSDELAGVKEAVIGELDAKGYSVAARRNRHLDWDLARRLAFSPVIAKLAARFLGPDLVLWRTNFFVGVSGKGYPWHQDVYNGLLTDTTNQISIHLGISEATPDNCVMVVPGSHLQDRHAVERSGFNFIAGTDEDGYGAPNFWRDPARNDNIVAMTLKPGEFFIFHPLLLHASVDMTAPPPPRPSRPVRLLRRLNALTRPAPKAGGLHLNGAPARVGLALRITVPQNKVLQAAFAETAQRGDRCMAIPVP